MTRKIHNPNSAHPYSTIIRVAWPELVSPIEIPNQNILINWYIDEFDKSYTLIKGAEIDIWTKSI